LTVDVGSGLRDEVDVVSRDDDLVLLSLRLLNGNTLKHLDVTNTLLSQEVTAEDERKRSAKIERIENQREKCVPDLDVLLVVRDDDVDGEMRVDETHLVGETETDTLDHVLDLGSDGAEASNVLASSVPDDELDLVDGGDSLLRGSDNTHRHANVLSVLRFSIRNLGELSSLIEKRRREKRESMMVSSAGYQEGVNTSSVPSGGYRGVQ
jgi:hypothetical protein